MLIPCFYQDTNCVADLGSATGTVWSQTKAFRLLSACGSFQAADGVRPSPKAL